MATSKVALATVLVVLMAVAVLVADARTGFESDSVIAGHGRSLLGKLDCGAACAGRCRLSSRPNLCKRACGTCCMKCSCVPSGTYGNYEECPCYAKLTTRGNKPKCP